MIELKSSAAARGGSDYELTAVAIAMVAGDMVILCELQICERHLCNCKFQFRARAAHRHTNVLGVGKHPGKF